MGKRELSLGFPISSSLGYSLLYLDPVIIYNETAVIKVSLFSVFIFPFINFLMMSRE